MNYKEILYFISKCLTITLEYKNRREIEKQLKLHTIDWDSVVKVSTSHYVLPALYCNLKRADFLQYLPQELVNYYGAYYQFKPGAERTNNYPSKRVKQPYY